MGIERTVKNAVQSSDAEEIIVSTVEPTGGNDGDIWLTYTP
jgi:hypothetical protein